ncbi:hypothetical protein [Sulfuriferula sp.]|uniref:hypothetical protein n=1 Tax=Sulfuriferula sp. TaxID=2025307 RepID=UPI00272F46E2|nr:hypothetical protein [Sulfuriferula sp.]MDP2024834.1 hypothetical protein [Sulfuriferula sp.]
MASTKEPFSAQRQCPVAGRIVSLSGVRVSLAGAVAIAQKNCSNEATCLKANGNLERIEGCLLHNLNG